MRKDKIVKVTLKHSKVPPDFAVSSYWITTLTSAISVEINRQRFVIGDRLTSEQAQELVDQNGVEVKVTG